MKIQITSFGLNQYPIDSIIAEYKQFVESHSKYKLNITTSKQPDINASEIGLWGTSNCYFVSPYSISSATKSILGSNVDVNIVLWNNQGLSVCWGGGTWGYDSTVNNALFVSIPFAWPVEPWGPWTYNYSQTISHEWIHTAAIMLGTHGYTIPDIDNCGAYGYTDTTDVGWQNCHKFVLASITDQMYQSVGELPSSTAGYNCVSPGNCQYVSSNAAFLDYNSCITSTQCQSAVTGYTCTNCNTATSCTPGVTPNCYSTQSACQSACATTCTPSCTQEEICLALVGLGCQKRMYVSAGIGAIILISLLR